MRPGNPQALLVDGELPSHLTAAQTSRFLQVSKQTVYRRSLHGEPLESVPILGTDMIPTQKVLAYWEFLKRRAHEKQARRRC